MAAIMIIKGPPFKISNYIHLYCTSNCSMWAHLAKKQVFIAYKQKTVTSLRCLDDSTVPFVLHCSYVRCKMGFYGLTRSFTALVVQLK